MARHAGHGCEESGGRAESKHHARRRRVYTARWHRPRTLPGRGARPRRHGSIHGSHRVLREPLDDAQPADPGALERAARLRASAAGRRLRERALLGHADPVRHAGALLSEALLHPVWAPR